MTFVHQESRKCTKSELYHFATPASIHKGQWIECHHLRNITDTGRIEFNVSGTGEEYLDLARTHLFVKAKITKANGTALDAVTQVGPVTLFLHSLFSQVDVSLNERPISAATNTYPYRAMIESLLNYGDEAKKSQLSMSMFYNDTAGKTGVVNPLAAHDEANLGLKARYEFTKKSLTVDMMGPIHSDIFFQHSSANLKYPIRRIDCRVLSIPRGFSSFNPDNIFLGQIPKRIVLVLVEIEAYNWSYRSNPFHFKHHNLTQVGVCVDGEQIP